MRLFDTTTGESVIDFIETIAPEHGGDDLIFVDEGADVVLGGSGMDVVHAGVGDFSDVVLGDNGEVDFDTTTVPGTALVKTIASEPTDFDGVDEIIVGDGEDFVIAGGEGDRVNYTLDADGEPVQIADGDDAADYVIGDYGQALFDTTTGESVIDFIETIAPEHGGDDLIFVDEGPDVVLGGSGMDVVHAGVGDFSDVVLGDNGEVDFDTLTVPGTALVETVTSTATGLGGVDEIVTGDGADYVIAGVGADRVNYILDPTTGEPVQVGGDDAADYVVGDNGNAEFDTTTGESVIDFIETIAPEHGGDDLIFVVEGADVVLGGSGMDVVHAGVGDFSDVVLGDNGEVDFDTTTVPGTALVKTIASEPTDFDGVDEIIVGDGEDFVIAGGEGDRVNYTLDADGEPVQIADGDDAADYVIGDYGQALFDTTTGESVIDFIETIAPEHGGDDLIFVDEGPDVVLGGSGMDVVHAGVGDFSDVVLGDNGEVDFDTLTVPGTALVETVTSTATGLGGVDEIVTGDGADYVIAGVGDDKVNVGVTAPDFGDDVVIGDNGHVEFDTTTGESVIDFIETIAPEHGGDDLIFVGEGADVVLGGSGMDVVHAGVGDFSDVVLGDNGEVDFDTTTVPGTALVKTIASEPTDFDGVDEIIVGDGEDFVIAGGEGDRVNYTLDADGEPVQIADGDDAADYVIGDYGQALFDTTTGESVIDFIETIAPEHGGDDLIFVDEGPDVVLGGSGMDVVHAGVGDFSDVVLGDNGEVDFDTLTVPGTALVETVTSTATGLGGVDEIVTGDGADYVIAGVGDDKVNVGVTAPDFGDDVVIGDNGHVEFDTTTGESVIDFIETIAPEHGGDDLIFVDEGADVVLGGSGMDVVHAGVGDFSDVVLGDNGEVDFDTTTVPGTALVKTIASEPTDFDGVDEIIVGDGEDFVIAGGEGDRVNYTLDADGEPVQIADGDDAADYVIGDYGQALFDTTTGESVIDFIETIAPEHGGDDLIFVDEGPDVVLGGSGMDVVHAGVGDFSDVVLGDNGEVDFDTLTVPGTALVETVTSTATGLGGVDEIVTGDGADYVIAGVGDDKVNVGVTAPDFGDDVVIGDNGHVEFDTTTGESVIDFIETIAPEHGGDDLIFVGEGADVVLGGSGMDVVHAGVGDFSDVVLGDNGEVDFDTTTVPGTALVKTIASEPTGFDGVDEIIVGDGEDFVIAGGEGDRVNYTLDADGEPVQIADGDDAADYVIGDYGQALFDTTTGESVIDFIETIAPEHGGDDLIFVDEGADVVLGGSGMDVVHAGVGDFSDVVLGDNGEVDFDTLTVPGTALVETVTSTATGLGGVDEIVTGDGADYVIAGVGDDKVNVGVTAPDFGDDVVIGDNGHVEFDTTTGESVIDFIETIAPEHGGDDLIFVVEGADVVLGGSGMDVVHAGVGDFSDVVLG